MGWSEIVCARKRESEGVTAIERESNMTNDVRDSFLLIG